MKLRKEQGGSMIGPYEWVNDGDVLDVDDAFGSHMLTHPGFSEVLPEPEEIEEPETDESEKAPIDETDPEDPPADETPVDAELPTELKAKTTRTRKAS